MPTATPTRPWQHWYGKKRWVARSRYQLRSHPLCAMCLQRGLVVAAKLADHVVPHKGDPMKFWYGELQSLCLEHHVSSKAQIERKGYVNDIGSDGFPIDREHPFNKR